MPPRSQAIWGCIWNHTVGKSQTSAANVIMHPLIQAIWEIIGRHIVEKSQTNVTNVIMHPLKQAFWWDIWKYTVEINQTNAHSLICSRTNKWFSISDVNIKYINMDKFVCGCGWGGALSNVLGPILKFTSIFWTLSLPLRQSSFLKWVNFRQFCSRGFGE